MWGRGRDSKGLRAQKKVSVTGAQGEREEASDMTGRQGVTQGQLTQDLPGPGRVRISYTQRWHGSVVNSTDPGTFLVVILDVN